jgi:protein SCO1
MSGTGSRSARLLCVLVALALGGPAKANTVEPGASSRFDATTALRISQSVIGKSIGDYSLLDRDGRSIRLSHYRGKPLLVNFIYTGCFQVCPTSTRALSASLQAMRGSYDLNQFNVVSIGFNQPADSPQALNAFMQQQRIDFANWAFLSPHAAIVDDLTRDFGFSFEPTQGGFDHLLQVTLVDAEGRIAAQVYGDDFGADRLGEPLRRLLRKQPMAAQLRLSEIIDRVRLLCSVYDPVSGKYRVSYALAFEVAGGITFAAAMLWFFALEWRSQLRRRRLLRAELSAQPTPAPSNRFPAQIP